MKIYKKQKGSALIIALLIMGILMTLALGLSDLVIREVKITADIINSGKAYYAAESGIESALLDLHQNLPGFETEDGVIDSEIEVNGQSVNVGLSDGTDLNYNYSIENKTQTIPYVDTEIVPVDVAQNSPKQYMYNTLELSESVTIPLFVATKEGRTKDVTDFRVEYFIDEDKIDPRWRNAAQSLEDIDMLRWKITGLNTKNKRCWENPSGKDVVTESIGDYLPVREGSTNANNPTCFGTETTGMSYTDNNGLFYPENCNGPIYKWAREAYVFLRDEGQIKTDARTDDPDSWDPMEISEFINCHENNYLTLINIFNPSVLEGLSDYEKRQNAKIYYRVIIPNENEYTIREFAKIISTGFTRDLRKQIEALIRPDRFMPVFNFSLYRTDVE